MSDSRRQQHNYNNKTLRYSSFPDASDDQAAICGEQNSSLKSLLAVSVLLQKKIKKAANMNSKTWK